MTHSADKLHHPGRRLAGSWGLIALGAGAAGLVLVALLALLLAGRQQPTLAPETTPEGVAQRFFAATYHGDYAAAYALLSDTTRREHSLADLQAQLSGLRASEMRIDAVAIHGETATVTITVIHYRPGGLFGNDEWSTESDLMLERDGATWSIVNMPLW